MDSWRIDANKSGKVGRDRMLDCAKAIVMQRRLCISRVMAPMLAFFLWAPVSSSAEPTPPETNIDLSKEADNPVARIISLPLRYEGTFHDGPTDSSTKSTFEIDQAILPFKLNDDWALITRTKLPFVSEPPKKSGQAWESGLSNGYTTFFLSPEHGEGYYWGVGPVLYYPASNSAVGVNSWGSGPSIAFVKKDASPWLFGAVVNNIWSFNGSASNSDRTNELLLNPFASYHFGDGWSVGSSPNITANWIGTGGKWTVPIGGGFSKTTHFGELPVKLAVDSYYNAVRPKAGSQTWLLQLTVTFLLNG